MVKVTIMTTAGQETELLPERLSLREVFSQFHADPEGAINSVNGSILQDEDWDKTLAEFSRDSEVRIVSVQKLPDFTEETAEPRAGVFVSSLSEVKETLENAREAIDAAMKALCEVVPF